MAFAAGIEGGWLSARMLGVTVRGSEVPHLRSCVGSRVQNPPEQIQLLLLEFLLAAHHMHDAAAAPLASSLQQSTVGSSNTVM